MIIHSKQFVTNLDDECIQPNAVDLRIAEIHTLDAFSEDEPHNSCIFLGNKGKQFFRRFEQSPRKHDVRAPGVVADELYFQLRAGKCYSFTTKHNVKLPEGVAGIVKGRSTLVRNGLILTTGLYDSGYDGPIGGMILNTAPSTVYIERDSRIAQFITYKAETTHLYDGHWNHNATR